MDTIKKEMYSLPLYDSQLKFWGFASDFSTERDNVPIVDETRGKETDSLTLTLSEFDSGRDSIEVVHYREGERLNHYSFRVVDSDARICANTQSIEDIPWVVRRALTRFGYYDRMTPSSERKFVFDHLLTSIPLLDECVNEEDVILRSWVNNLIAAIATFTFFKSTEYQLPYTEYKTVIAAIAENLREFSWWQPDVDYDEFIFERIYNQTDIETPVYLPRIDSDVRLKPNSSEEQERISESDDHDSNEETTVLELSVNDNPESQYVFASHISRYAIDRYRFNTIDGNRLVLEHGDDPDLPPYLVLRYLQRYDQEVMNVPTFQPSNGIVTLIEKVDELLQWVLKQQDIKHRETVAAYSRYITRLDKILGIAVLWEHDTENYRNLRDDMFQKYNIDSEDIDPENISVEKLNRLIEPLINQFEPETFEIVEEKLEELQIHERQDEFEQLAEEYVSTEQQ